MSKRKLAAKKLEKMPLYTRSRVLKIIVFFRYMANQDKNKRPFFITEDHMFIN